VAHRPCTARASGSEVYLRRALARVSLVGEIHVHGRGCVAEDLVSLRASGLTILSVSFISDLVG
jgi:hypothetical protein